MGVLGLAVGLFSQGSNSNHDAANQSKTSLNTTNKSTGGQPEVSESEAISIALSRVGTISRDYYIKTIYSSGNPHKWQVDFYDSATNTHLVGVSVDAVTGAVRAVYRWR